MAIGIAVIIVISALMAKFHEQWSIRKARNARVYKGQPVYRMGNNWHVYVEDVLLKDYRNIRSIQDYEQCFDANGLPYAYDCQFHWVSTHTHTIRSISDKRSSDDNAYLRMIFPVSLCRREENVLAFAREAFNRLVDRIRNEG